MRPEMYGPSVTSSNGLDVITAINSNPNLLPLYANDPRGAADNPLNYPVGTVTIFNGLGNFSENSAFNRLNRRTLRHAPRGLCRRHVQCVSDLNITFGVNYVRDSGRTDSDLAPLPCSAINTTIVKTPPCITGLILDQFGLNLNNAGGEAQFLGQSVKRPDWNFAPQAGVAWDPGHHGRTVVRASGGLFYDNFLLQNIYQDRINRLSNGQYNRSLTLCPAGSVLFPNGSVVSSVDRRPGRYRADLWAADWRHDSQRSESARGRVASDSGSTVAVYGGAVGGDRRPERVLAGQQPGEFRGPAGAWFQERPGWCTWISEFSIR